MSRCARDQRRPVGARLALQAPGLDRHARARGTALPRSDEEADRAEVGERRCRVAEDLPHLLAREREQGEDRQQRDGVGEQPERGAQLAREPREDPAQDRQQPVDEDRVDQRQEQQVGADRGRGAAHLAAEDQRQERRQDARRPRARSCRSRCGIARAGRPWSTFISRDRRAARTPAAPSDREQVLPPRPIELTGAEQLADEDQARAAAPRGEDVGRRREALDEHRQPGAPELALVGGDAAPRHPRARHSARFSARARAGTHAVNR